MEMEEAKMEIFTNNFRDYPRSDARLRYGRASSRQGITRSSGHVRNSAVHEKKPPATFKEKIVFQATICGGFLAVLLFFNIIDSSFTNSVTGWINRNISYNMLSEEDGIGGWVDSVMSIFNNNDMDDSLPQHYEAFREGEEINAVLPLQTELLFPANTIDSSRIDENILRDIEAMTNQ